MKNNAENIVVVDIGSNSVRLFIFEIKDRAAHEIFSKKFFCGLGRDLGTTGKLNPEAVLMAKEQLVSFRKEIQKFDIQDEIVVGTAALREAKDSGEFLNDIKSQSGFEIKIIEGIEEARLAALAILSVDPLANGVVADFGGGSLELAKLGHGKIEKKISLKLGAHYLKQMADREAGIEAVLQDAFVSNPEFLNPSSLYVIGGSWRSLAKAWQQEKGETNVSLEGFSFEGHEILEFCADLMKKEPNELTERYQMEAPRARLMDVSALMLSRLLERLSPQQVRISTAGIRDGLAYDYILTRREQEV